MFGPYTPLQQLDLLADDDTKSYVVGSTNSLLLAQKDRYSDILINVRPVLKVPSVILVFPESSMASGGFFLPSRLLLISLRSFISNA